MKNKFDFAADSITVNGKTFPARYEVTAAAVNVFTTVTEDGNEKTVCICINAGDSLYGPAALAAVQEAPQTVKEAQAEQEAEQTEQEAEQTAEEAQTEQEAPQTAEEAQAEPEAQRAEEEAQAKPEAQQAEEEAQAEPEAQQTEPEAPQAVEEAQAEQEAPQAARDPKTARGPVSEKTFIGQSITGAGWAIIFDGSCNRTRVIISKGQHDKLRGIVESAGFYYSATLDSWNRKLTFRAYRAAQALAQELTAALAA